MIYINTTLHTIVFLNKNDRKHRYNGPAHINGNRQTWWLEGKLHRLDGPAFISGNRQEWWLNGKCHRLDGPAFISGNYKEWYIKGIQYTEHEYHNKLKEMGLE